jgi:putative flippase GtrA
VNKILLYIYFAFFASIINIFSQYLVFESYEGAYIIYIAMFVGTSLGLISKYIMDKMYIFKYSISNLYDYSKNFSAYVLTGIFTTLIFWSFEYLFYILFNNEIAIYLGAIIGLSIGYTVKYKLDKNFVFK